MQALVKEKAGPGLALKEIVKPQIRNPDDILFQVAYCGVCNTDTRLYDWDGWATANQILDLPAVLGHEVSGIVTEVGSGATEVQPGDRIVVDPFIHCGRCYQCRTGHTSLCVDREIYGKRRGGFGEYSVVPERVVCKLSNTLSLEEGALLENLGIAVHAVEAAQHDPGDLAVVVGAGPIGILAAQTLIASGVDVVLTDMVDERLELAEAISGATVINVKHEDYSGTIQEMSDGKGASFVLEAAATQSALEQAFEVVGTRGTVVTIGTFNGPVSFNPFFTMTRKEVRFVGSIGRTWQTWRRMQQLVDSERISLKPLITHVLPIEKYEEGFQLARSHKAMKVLLHP